MEFPEFSELSVLDWTGLGWTNLDLTLGTLRTLGTLGTIGTLGTKKNRTLTKKLLELLELSELDWNGPDWTGLNLWLVGITLHQTFDRFLLLNSRGLVCWYYPTSDLLLVAQHKNKHLKTNMFKDQHVATNDNY